ncbi:alpha/Beta hydrolase [Arthrobacter sp. Hiyo4]|nr:alpha/Beta hydrolase [Arthrobacter sp. Hiyo4]
MEGLWNGFTVFAWDAPGCGQSDDPSPDLTDRDLGDILAAVLQAAVKGKPHARLRRWSGASPRSHPAGMRAIVNALGRSDYRDALPVITIPALLL